MGTSYFNENAEGLNIAQVRQDPRQPDAAQRVQEREEVRLRVVQGDIHGLEPQGLLDGQGDLPQDGVHLQLEGDLGADLDLARADLHVAHGFGGLGLDFLDELADLLRGAPRAFGELADLSWMGRTKGAPVDPLPRAPAVEEVAS